MKFKRVLRYSPNERMLRLFRLTWDIGEVGFGGVSHKISVGLQRSLLYFDRECDGWRATLLGFHVSHKRSYGGRFA